MAVLILPDRAYVREALAYNARTGEFRWRQRPLAHFQADRHRRIWNSRLAGAVTGWVMPRGYRQIRLDDRLYLAHRLAWLIIHGEPVPLVIDHVDGNPGNNRIDNLRPASQAENIANSRMHYDNPTGVKGVRFSKGGRFNARIKINYREINLGTFDTLEAAAEARREAAMRLQGTFARHD